MFLDHCGHFFLQFERPVIGDKVIVLFRDVMHGKLDMVEAAFLEFLEGKELPAVTALEARGT